MNLQQRRRRLSNKRQQYYRWFRGCFRPVDSVRGVPLTDPSNILPSFGTMGDFEVLRFVWSRFNLRVVPW